MSYQGGEIRSEIGGGGNRISSFAWDQDSYFVMLLSLEIRIFGQELGIKDARTHRFMALN